MEIDKEGIWNVYATENKDIKGMIVHYGWRTPWLFDRHKCESEVKTTEE